MITQGIAHIRWFCIHFLAGTRNTSTRTRIDGVVMLHAFGKRRSWQPDLEMCTCMIDRLNVGLNSKWRVSFAIKRTLDLKLDEDLFRIKPLSDFEKILHEDSDQNQNLFFHSYLRKLAADFMWLCCVGLLITYLSSVAKLSVAYYTTFWGIEYRKCSKSKIKDVWINIVYSVKAGCWMLGHDGCTHGQRSRRTRSTHPPPHSPWHRVTVTMIILDFINFAEVDYLFLSF